MKWDTIDIFAVQTYCMRYVGIWPGPVLFAMGWQHVLLAFINGLLSTYTNVTEILFAVQHKAELQLTMDCLCLTTTRSVSTVKIFMLIYRRHKFKQLMDIVYGRYLADLKTRSVKIYKRLVRIDLFFSAGLFISANAALFLFFVMPALKWLAGNYEMYERAFKSQLPYNHESLLAYVLTYLVDCHVGLLITITAVGIDGMFVGCCLCISGQFKTIARDLTLMIERVVDPTNRVDFLTPEQNQRIKQQLIELVKQHNECIDVTQFLVREYTLIIQNQFISASFVLGMASINLILAEGLEKLIYINYLAAATMQMFCYCFSAQFLEDSSSTISWAAYHFEWYKCDKNVRLLVQMMMMRANKQCQVTVPFFSASLPTFASIIQSAGSYITLLQTFL